MRNTPPSVETPRRELVGRLRRRVLASACGCALLVVAASPASAQRIALDTWTTENGLPQNSVNDIVQTRDGYLWLATFGGLVRFDGTRFVVFDRSVEGIGSQRIRTVFEGREGTLWAATEDGMVIRYREGRFTTYGAAERLPHAVATRIDEDAQGHLWITWRGPITRYDGARFVTFEGGDLSQGVRNPLPIASVGPNDLWWNRDEAGLHCLYKGVVFRCADNETLMGDDILRVTLDDHDNIWVVTKGSRVLRVAFGGSRLADTPITWPDTGLDGIFLRDREGTVWASRNGLELYRIRNGRWELIAPMGVLSLFEDREGSIWVGSTLGLYRVRQQAIALRDAAEGLSSNLVYSILEDGRRHIWVGTWGGGVNRYAGDRWTVFREANGLPSDLVTSLLEDRAGHVWVGTSRGVARFDRGVLEPPYDPPLAHLGGAVWAMHEERPDVMWFATDNGLVRVEEGVAERFTSVDGLPHDRVTALFGSRSGALWVGTFQGLARVEKGVFTSYGEREGLIGNQVRAIHEDSDGMLWIGTYDGGLYRLKDGRLTRFTTRNGLHDNGVFQILEDDSGHFWMGSNRGISRVSRRDLNDFADGKIASIRSRAFGIRDGLATLECNGGRQPSGLRTAAGRLWFPTMGGVAIVNPSAIPPSGPPPPVIVEELLVQGRAVPLTAELTIPHDSNSVEIRYTAASFAAPEQVRFRHRLVGLDEDWIDAGHSRTAKYYRIPPGRYEFAVTASGEEGGWNEDARTVTLVVLAPLWRQPWFLGAALVATMVVAVVLDRRRVWRHRREQATQAAFTRRLMDAQEAERKRIATELHDSIGQDLFIIRAHVRSARNAATAPGTLDDTLETIDVAARKASDDLKEVAHALRPYHLEKIGLAATIRSMLTRMERASGIPFTTDLDDLDDRLDADAQIAVFRVVQESASNVVKHSGATSGHVVLRARGEVVELRVEDNGRRGLEPAALDEPGMRGAGLGLSTIRERARALGGEAVVRPAPDGGTAVVMTFPLERRTHGG